jgi:ketosteroid isomerase-like protein
VRSLRTVAGITFVSTILMTSACNTTPAFSSASTAVSASLAQMGAAANAHDIDKHVGFYAHDASTELIFNGEQIIGWDSIRAKQAEWWNGGKTDVVYTVLAKPDVRAITLDLVITTLVMKSRRTAPSGDVTEGSFAVSSVWQKRPEGWKVIYSHESTSH